MSAPLYSGSPWVAELTTGGVTAGVDGTDGINAYTYTSLAFTQPAVSANVTVSVINSDWMAVGQVIYINTGGYYQVVSKPGSTSVVLTNLGYSGNAAAGTAIAISSLTSPAGPPGTSSTGVYSGTAAELAASPPAAPALWILTDSDPLYQVVPII